MKEISKTLFWISTVVAVGFNFLSSTPDIAAWVSPASTTFALIAIAFAIRAGEVA